MSYRLTNATDPKYIKVILIVRRNLNEEIINKLPLLLCVRVVKDTGSS